MYRGLGPTVLAHLPQWAIYFAVYHKSDEALSRIFGELIIHGKRFFSIALER